MAELLMFNREKHTITLVKGRKQKIEMDAYTYWVGGKPTTVYGNGKYGAFEDVSFYASSDVTKKIRDALKNRSTIFTISHYCNRETCTVPYRRSFRVTQADNDLAGWDAGKEEITLWTLTIVECDEPQDFGQKWREIAEKHSWGTLSPTTWDAVKTPPIVF